MAEGPTGERSELPTQRKLEEAKRQGNVTKSADLTSAVAIFGALIGFLIWGDSMVAGLLDMVKEGLVRPGHARVGIQTTSDLFASLGLKVMLLAGPFALLMMLVGVGINLLQAGYNFTPEKLKPSADRFNPISGLKKLFDVKSLMMMVMSIAKVAIIGLVAWGVLEEKLGDLAGLALLTHEFSYAFLTSLLFDVMFRCALVLFILGLLDFWWQSWKRMQDLKMSKQDIKEEQKTAEGDPQLKQRRKSVQMQLARQRMMKDVESADVVITNPTHLALAIKYDPERMPAPRVVAKGARHLALKIREVALAYSIPLVEQKPLARALYEACEMGDYIPEDLYQAVAEVLAYVAELDRAAMDKFSTV